MLDGMLLELNADEHCVPSLAWQDQAPCESRRAGEAFQERCAPLAAAADAHRGAQVASFMRAVCRTLQQCHVRSILHRARPAAAGALLAAQCSKCCPKLAAAPHVGCGAGNADAAALGFAAAPPHTERNCAPAGDIKPGNFMLLSDDERSPLKAIGARRHWLCTAAAHVT